MTTVEGKVFSITLVDLDYFDTIRAYLKRLKYFKYGIAISTKTQRDFDIMYIYVKYSKKKTLDMSKLHNSRVHRKCRLNVEDIKLMKDNGEVVWEEGFIVDDSISYKQKKIDNYLIIDKQVNILIK